MSTAWQQLLQQAPDADGYRSLLWNGHVFKTFTDEACSRDIEMFTLVVTRYSDMLPQISEQIAAWYPPEWGITAAQVQAGLGPAWVYLLGNPPEALRDLDPIKLTYLEADFDDHIIDVSFDSGFQEIREVLLDG